MHWISYMTIPWMTCNQRTVADRAEGNEGVVMNIQEMKKFLRDNYGINNMNDLDMAMAEAPGIDLGIFTGTIPGKEKRNDNVEVCTA